MTMRTNGEILDEVKKDLQELADFWDLYKFDIIPERATNAQRKRDEVLAVLEKVKELDKIARH